MIIRAGEIVFDGALDHVRRGYATHKMVVAHLDRTDDAFVVAQDLLNDGAELDEAAGTLRFSVPRDDVAAAAARVLQHCCVRDLAIEEMDIGTVIERIFKERGEVRA